MMIEDKKKYEHWCDRVQSKNEGVRLRLRRSILSYLNGLLVAPMSVRVLHKKAQFYLFTMIILLAMVSTFIISKPVSMEVDKSFDNYFENIDREIEYALNGAILYDSNISTEVSTFFTHISELGRSRRIDLSYFYLIVNSTNMSFHNSMVSDIYLIDYNVTL